MEPHVFSDWTEDALLATPLPRLLEAAAHCRDEGHPGTLSYSRKVFIPLTQLCRDVCHYCTFAQTPRAGSRAYLTEAEVLRIAHAGERAGCTEALFTLGDQPEARYHQAREELKQLGYDSTIEYLAAMCAAVLRESTLLPHVNPGLLTAGQLQALRQVSISQGLMLENASDRLCQKGQVHYGSPDKVPALRLATLRAAGEQAVPFTTGILIGIGETRQERLQSLISLRDLHRQYGHLQEIIVQNFRAKPGTKLARATEPDLSDLMWTIACARLLFGPAMNIQAPPNLTPLEYSRLVSAGINDWGGVSPVTPDYVNPEAPWPEIDRLRELTAAAGKTLVERLPLYPSYALDAKRWVASGLHGALLRSMDTEGYARMDAWAPGLSQVRPPPPHEVATTLRPARRTLDLASRAAQGERLEINDIATLFSARGADYDAICRAADDLRRQECGDTVSYVVTRNINYTNVCQYRCSFCAFSKGRQSNALRGRSYDLAMDEILRRAREAVARGATEVCMQGGIHPSYTGDTYLELVAAIRRELPGLHIHAFSPLEISHGASTLGLPIADFLERLKDAGLGTLPGTAAEILCDDVRRIICPDKVNSAQWLEIVEAAHRVGLRTTSTIMFGHVERIDHWARHLLSLRDLQARTGGITEFVPLPFVHMEAPMYRRGQARSGPTFREAVLMHAVSRLVLHPHISNIQVSWVKLGPDGARTCLQAGANDLGGTLMNESISKAAGTEHGQEMGPASMDALARSIGRQSRQRNTFYGNADPALTRASYLEQELAPVVLTPATKKAVNASPIYPQAAL